MTLRLALIALSALAFTVGPAQAQNKKELVAKVLQLHQQGIENIGRVIAGQTSQQMLQAAGQAMPRVAADKRDAVGKDIQDEVKKFYDEVEPMLKKRAVELAPATVGAAYEEKFSEDELKVIVSWLESPVSRKYAEIDRAQGNALAEKVVADTRPAIEPKLKALEAAVAKRLGVPPGGEGAPAADAAAKPAKPAAKPPAKKP
jgi:uncharacterized protein